MNDLDILLLNFFNENQELLFNQDRSKFVSFLKKELDKYFEKKSIKEEFKEIDINGMIMLTWPKTKTAFLTNDILNYFKLTSNEYPEIQNYIISLNVLDQAS